MIQASVLFPNLGSDSDVKTLTRWFGLAFGLGLSRKVAEAYTYLIDFWKPNDRVFLFGFSRALIPRVV